MWKFFERVDKWFLDRVATPVAHYTQVHYGVSNYELSYHCLETTAFIFFLLSAVEIGIRGEEATWWLLIDGASIAWLVTCGLVLRNHMKRSDWYKVRPAYSINFLPGALWGALLLLCALMMWRHGGYALKALSDNPYVLILETKKQVFFLDSVLRAMLVFYPLGFYFERVMPLPPGSKPKESLSEKEVLSPT